MDNKELPLTDFDYYTTKGRTQILKALIPYLSPSEQMMIGIIVRIWELVMTIIFFRKNICISIPCTKEIPFDPALISHIKKYCTAESTKMLDSMMQVMNVSEIMKAVNWMDGDGKSTDNPGDIGNIMNILNSVGNAASHMSDSASKNTLNPSDILTSMMNSSQEDLYKEFMDKLNNDF